MFICLPKNCGHDGICEERPHFNLIEIGLNLTAKLSCVASKSLKTDRESKQVFMLRGAEMIMGTVARRTL